MIGVEYCVEVSLKDLFWGRRTPVKETANAIFDQRKQLL